MQFADRIGFAGTLEDISREVCGRFHLGRCTASQVVPVGYEDFNFILKAGAGTFFVKVFSTFRTLQDCRRYIEIMEAAIEHEISTPKLIESDDGALHVTTIQGSELRLCVMEHIEGQNLYQSRARLDDTDTRFLARQAAMISQIPLKPYAIYDHWAIPNFLVEFETASKYLSSQDRELLVPLVSRFSTLHVESLPHCFVHGDIIKTNVIKDLSGKLWILDFSVSNYYPRIQELAVLACNVFFDQISGKTSQRNLALALEEYEKTTPLTRTERQSLPTYIELAHAMHVLCATREKVAHHNMSEENEYWIDQGRKGLLQMRKDKILL